MNGRIAAALVAGFLLIAVGLGGWSLANSYALGTALAANTATDTAAHAACKDACDAIIQINNRLATIEAYIERP